MPLESLPLAVEASLVAAAAVLPPALFIALAFTFARARALSTTARELVSAAERIYAMDETAAATAGQLGRTEQMRVASILKRPNYEKIKRRDGNKWRKKDA